MNKKGIERFPINVMIIREDWTEYRHEPGFEKKYFDTGDVARGLIYRDGKLVGIYSKDQGGNVFAFSRRIQYYPEKARPFLVQWDDNIDLKQRDRTFKYFDSMLEVLYHESLLHKYEMRSDFTSARWVPVSEFFVRELISRAGIGYEHRTTHDLACLETLDRGEELYLHVQEVNARFSIRERRPQTRDRYIINYPNKEPLFDQTRDDLLRQFPELEKLFEHFDIDHIADLRFVNNKRETVTVVGILADVVEERE